MFVFREGLKKFLCCFQKNVQTDQKLVQIRKAHVGK